MTVQTFDNHAFIGDVIREFCDVYEKLAEFSARVGELHNHQCDLTSSQEALVRIQAFTQASAVQLEGAYRALGDVHSALHQIHSLVYHPDEAQIARADRELTYRITRHAYLSTLRDREKKEAQPCVEDKPSS